MRKIKLFIFLSFLFSFQLFAYKPQGFVNDFAGVLDNHTKQEVNTLLSFVEQKSGVEIAFVVVPNMQGDTIDNYAVNLFQKWGIGKKGKDNGLLILMAQKERRVRIEVGYGLESIIPDGLAGEIRDKYLIPFLKQDDYNKATIYSSIAISQIISKAYNFSLDNIQMQVPKRKRSGKALFKLIFYLIVLLLFMGGGFGGFWPLLFLGGFGGGGSWSSGDSGFGGGFGGFGGGMSGGGGASGSF